MSEYEYLDLISTYRTETGFHVMNFIAAMSGYIAAAYFVGDKLTSFQVAAITVLYTAFSPLPVVAAYEALNDGRIAQMAYAEKTGTSFDAGNVAYWGPELALTVVTMSWIISILFMFQTRIHRVRTDTPNKSLEPDA